jgi:predicted amidohydrolase
MQVLLAQLCPVPGDNDANAARAAELIAEHPEADLAVFPELYLSGYNLRQVHDCALDTDAAALDLVRRAAADAATAVVVGFVERAGDELCNSAALIDEGGRLAGVYRKVALFGREADVFTPGDRLVVVQLAGRRVGPLVCFDIEFPELARQLAVAGAELLVTASANMEPYYADHELATRARALDNRLPHVYVNRVGGEGRLRFVGGSRVIAPDGAVQLQSPQQDEHVQVVTVDPAPAPDGPVHYLAQVPDRLPVALIDSVSGGTT